MNPALGLACARIAIGTVALVAPRSGTKLFRLDAAANPQLPYMTRLFGSRELLMGPPPCSPPARPGATWSRPAYSSTVRTPPRRSWPRPTAG